MITIEAAQPSDLPELQALLVRSDLPPDGLSEHIGAALVARDDARIVGSAALELYGQAALLRSLAVEPALRRQRLGQQLVRAALSLARQRGVAEIYLLTTSAAEFFPRFGFAPIERAGVAPAVRQSIEFVSACPASAQAPGRPRQATPRLSPRSTTRASPTGSPPSRRARAHPTIFAPGSTAATRSCWPSVAAP
jgi:amino-acid N-acetyltransferase